MDGEVLKYKKVTKFRCQSNNNFVDIVDYDGESNVHVHIGNGCSGLIVGLDDLCHVLQQAGFRPIQRQA